MVHTVNSENNYLIYKQFSPRDIMAKGLDCSLEVSDFELSDRAVLD